MEPFRSILGAMALPLVLIPILMMITEPGTHPIVLVAVPFFGLVAAGGIQLLVGLMSGPTPRTSGVMPASDAHFPGLDLDWEGVRSHPVPTAPARATRFEIMGVSVVSWPENQFRHTQVKVAPRSDPPDPRLDPLHRHLTAVEGARLDGTRLHHQKKASGWEGEARERATQLAMAAICLGHDYDSAVDALTGHVAGDAPDIEVTERLLVHLDDPRVTALARRWAAPDSPLHLAALICLGDLDALEAVVDPGHYDTTDSKRALRALAEQSEERARALVRRAPEKCALADASLVTDLLAAPHLEPDDVALLLTLTRRPGWPAELLDKNLRALAQLNTEASRGVLVDMLGSDDPDLAERAGQHLTGLGDARARALLVERLTSGSNDEQVFAATWLGCLGTLDDVEPLMAVRDKTLELPRVRQAAAYAITALQAGVEARVGSISFAHTSGDEEGALSPADDTAGELSLTAGPGESLEGTEG